MWVSGMVIMTEPGGTGRGQGSTLSPQAFDRLLSAFDGDKARAGEIYEKYRKRLRYLFMARGCRAPDDRVDRTFDRVAQKLLQDGEDIRDMTGFILRVAYFIHMEGEREEGNLEPLGDDIRLDLETDDLAEKERLHAALEFCLEQLTQDERYLIKCYYQGEKREKKDGRKKLAAELDITMNALGQRAFRIRNQLEACISSRGERLTP